MTTADTSLAPFYQGWETYQGYLTNAIAPLLSEHLALRAASHLRSIGLLAAHIIAARVVACRHGRRTCRSPADAQVG